MTQTSGHHQVNRSVLQVRHSFKFKKHFHLIHNIVVKCDEMLLS